jgi:hypothetical protein
MNEQIEKIYGEACIAAGNLDERDFCEHFAKLLIKQCAELCANIDGGENMFSRTIRKNFGVKE